MNRTTKTTWPVAKLIRRSMVLGAAVLAFALAGAAAAQNVQ